MKCPKCGYLGFDTGPRCRNCSYDFALLEAGDEGTLPLDLDRGFSMAEPTLEESAHISWIEAIDRGIARAPGSGPATPVPMDAAGMPAGARTGFDARDLDAALHEPDTGRAAGFNAGERVAGETVVAGTPAPAGPPLRLDALDVPVTPAVEPPVPEALVFDLPAVEPASVPDPFTWPVTPAPFRREDALPALESVSAPADVPPALRSVRTPPAATRLDPDAPLVQLQRPRAPVAVRKTPMSPKLRAVTQPRPTEPELDFLAGLHAGEGEHAAAAEPSPAVTPAEDSPAIRRLGALLLDLLLFGGIDLAVVYLTLRIVGLRADEIGVLPVWPMLVFLGFMQLAYAAVFTALGGQTIGKMAMHIRVVAVDDRPLSWGAAVRRTLASLVSVVTAGLGYLPGLIGRDRRALHDRLAGSRVVTLGAA